MIQEEQLRQQRQALNTAINNHDLETSTSFLHPDFVARATDGHSYDRQAAVRQLEQMLQPSMNLHSQVDVEHVEVSGDSATLRICRTESGRMDRPGVFWGFLAAAAYLAYTAIDTVVSDAAELPNYTPIRFWVGLVGGLAGGAIGFVCFIVGAFYLGRRSMHQTQRAEETWRRVDGRWLLAGERQISPASKTNRRQLIQVVVGTGAALVVVVAVGAYGAWSVFTGSGTEFQRSGNPALKLEVRRASTKEVAGWKASTTPDDPEGKNAFVHVSPDVELSNEDVLSTRAHFSPLSKAVSRWKGGVCFWVISVVLFVVWWRSKQRGWGVAGVVCLLVGLGSLWHGLTSTAERFEQQGSWRVVIRFNDAGTKKLADITAALAPTQKYPPNRRPYPSNHLAFLIDGELSFVVPVWEQHTEGVYHLLQSTHFTKSHDPEGLSEEYVTRIAKGIVGP
jgi:hypothetical protein